MTRWVLLVAMLAASTAYAGPSQEQLREAGEHFTAAQAADKAGKYRDAISEYEAAYALVPHVDTLYNIAVDYEKLEDYSKAIQYYLRYLDERDTPPKDAAEVQKKIRELRQKVPAEPAPDPYGSGGTNHATDHPHDGAGWGDPSKAPNGGRVDANGFLIVEPEAPTVRPRWHAGVKYGFAFGNFPTERYLGHGGITFAQRIELDAVLGAFGANDYAVGAMLRIVLSPQKTWSPFLRGAVTIGYAKSDASSRAEVRAPIGFEAGGGVQLGKTGRVTVEAVLRAVSGGWDSGSTFEDSYINDSVALAFDVGVALDLPPKIPSKWKTALRADGR